MNMTDDMVTFVSGEGMNGHQNIEAPECFVAISGPRHRLGKEQITVVGQLALGKGS